MRTQQAAGKQKKTLKKTKKRQSTKKHENEETAIHKQRIECENGIQKNNETNIKTVLCCLKTHML
jgi:hypothetical protein